MSSRSFRGVLCLTVVASMTGLVVFDPLLHARGEERTVGGNMSPGRNKDPSIWGDDESRGSRCFLDPTLDADPTQTGNIQQRCHPNVFLIGVSKCGTSSIADWMYHHPAMRWVNVKKDGELLEAVTVELPNNPMLHWNGLTASPVADETHKVMDYNSNYITRAEVALRLARIYGRASYDGSLKYLVMLRDPVRRTISSWEYKVANADARVSNGQVHDWYEGSQPIASVSSTIFTDGAHRNAVYRMKRARIAFGWSHTSCKYVGDVEPLVSRCIDNCSHMDGRSFYDAVSRGIFSAKNLMVCREKQLARLLPGVGQDRANSDPHLHLDAGGLLELDVKQCNLRRFVTWDLRNAHVMKGLYAIQLQRWMTLFGRENIKVVFLEDIMQDPLGGLESVLNFFGLDLLDPEGEKGLQSRQEWQRVMNMTHNGTDPKVKEDLNQQVTPEIVQGLREFFAPHNRDLESLLGIELPSSWNR